MIHETIKSDNILALKSLPSRYKMALKNAVNYFGDKLLSIRCNMQNIGDISSPIISGSMYFLVDSDSKITDDLSEEDIDILLLDLMHIKDNTSYSELFGVMYTKTMPLQNFTVLCSKMNVISTKELEDAINV